MCMFCRSLFVLLYFFLLVIVWSVLLRYTDYGCLPLVSSNSSYRIYKKKLIKLPTFTERIFCQFSQYYWGTLRRKLTLRKIIAILRVGARVWSLMSLYYISDISWRSVLLVEVTGVQGENHQPVASHWRTISHNVDSSTSCHERDSNSQL